jgi:hypothetical protein
MTQGAQHGPGSADPSPTTPTVPVRVCFTLGLRRRGRRPLRHRSGPDATESAKAPKGWAIAGQVTWSDHSGRHDSQPRHEP